jgi:hypothetical protein
MKRQQIRVGGRWANKETDRVAIITRILYQLVYPHTVEYKYERPLRYKNPIYEYMTRDPFTRRTRVPYRTFRLNFKKACS